MPRKLQLYCTWVQRTSLAIIVCAEGGPRDEDIDDIVNALQVLVGTSVVYTSVIYMYLLYV